MELAIALLVICALLGTFLDAFVTPDARHRFRERLQTFSSVADREPLKDYMRALPERINQFFCLVFGRHHFSVRCMVTSFLFSTFSMALFAAIFFAIQGQEFINFAKETIFISGPSSDQIAPGTVLAYVVSNAIADYISLIETRYLLLLLIGRSIPVMGLVAILDLFLSYAIYEMIAVPLYMIIEPSSSIFEVFPPGAFFTGYFLVEYKSFFNLDFLSMFVYSTLATSILVHLVFLGSLVIWFLSLFSKPLSGLAAKLASFPRPFALLGVIASLGCILAAWLRLSG